MQRMRGWIRPISILRALKVHLIIEPRPVITLKMIAKVQKVSSDYHREPHRPPGLPITTKISAQCQLCLFTFRVPLSLAHSKTLKGPQAIFVLFFSSPERCSSLLTSSLVKLTPKYFTSPSLSLIISLTLSFSFSPSPITMWSYRKFCEVGGR